MPSAVEVVRAGELTAPHAYAFRPPGPLPLRLPLLLRPGGQTLRMPMLWFVLRHPTEGTILVDTGVHPETARDLRSDLGPVLGVLFRSMKPADTFDHQLSALAIDAAEVRLVVMTHLHGDHTGGMRMLPNAEFVCSRREWKATRARSAAMNGYVRHHLPDESRVRLVDPERDGEAHGAFTSTIDLLGDDTIRLVSTPGHTPGHMSVLVRLPREDPVLLVADAAYTRRNIEEEILPFITADDDLYRRSLRELRAFAEREPDVPLVPTHDPDAWRELAAA